MVTTLVLTINPMKSLNNESRRSSGGYVMAGSVRCAKRGCGLARNEDVCPRCGTVAIYISLYFKGKHYRFARNKQGRVLKDINEARDLHAEIRLAVNNGTFNPRDYTKTKIDERRFIYQATAWLNQKMEEEEAGELSPETLKNYKGYANIHFKSLCDYDVRDINYAVLENFKDDLPKTLKIKTRRNILNALHDLFVRMHKKGVIKDFPAWPVIEGDDSYVRSALTFEEQMDGLSKIPERADRETMEFGFETGLRPGETCAAKVKDVDVINRQILVRRTWSGKHLIERTKGKNKMWLPLSERAWEIIKPRIKDALPEAFIFVNPRKGRPYRPKVLNRLWKAFSGYADIDHYSASRHSFCTQLVHDGLNPLEAQAAMRHKDLKSTQKYFHAHRDRMREHFNRRGRAYNKHNESKTKNEGLGE